MTDVLVALVGDRRMGELRRGPRGSRLTFVYDEAWRSAGDAFPLSLSLPLAAREHAHAPTATFLWGLLPDNERVLERWATRFQVSPGSAFGLLAHVGEDCAGAVQFVRPGRLDRISGGRREVQWLDERAIAARLARLRQDQAAWRDSEDLGQFSLAGTQPKTALLFENGRFGVPAGRTPTTHILKPPVANLAGHVENEHLCLVLARTLGLPAASSEVRRFGGEVAIVIERYDRARASGHRRPTIVRLHQEDACQALGLPPTAKYQNEGGPSPENVAALLREHSDSPDEDVAIFGDALVFAWLTGGTDAHAKNYSLLHGPGRRVRLAPLYDLASALPYPHLDPHKLKLAMKLGGTYRLKDIGRHQLEKLAVALDLPRDALVTRALAFAARSPGELSDIRDRALAAGLDAPVVERVTAALATRARKCRAVLG